MPPGPPVLEYYTFSQAVYDYFWGFFTVEEDVIFKKRMLGSIIIPLDLISF